jgi:hypothetical protein
MKHLDFKTYMKQWEDAAANSAGGGGVAGIGVGPQGEPGLTPDQIKKHKKKVRLYDGRTKEGKKFVQRILARRAAREANRKVD